MLWVREFVDMLKSTLQCARTTAHCIDGYICYVIDGNDSSKTVIGQNNLKYLP